MSAAAKIEPSTVRLAARLPTQTPGHSRFPASSSAATAMPDPGQSAVAYPGGIAMARASFAAAKYATARNAASPSVAQRLDRPTACSSTALSVRNPAMLRQPPLEVRLEVGQRLEAHREAHQALGDPRGGARLRRDAPVRSGGRMGDGGLDVPEVRGDRDEARRIDDPPGGFAPALHLEGHDRAPRALLAPRQRMLRVGFEPRVVHALDCPMALEPARELERRPGLRAHAKLEGLQPFQDHPGVEGRER